MKQTTIKPWFFSCLTLIVVVGQTSIAQGELSNWRKIWISNDTIIHTNYPIIPGSIQLIDPSESVRIKHTPHSISIIDFEGQSYLTFRVFQSMISGQSPSMDRYVSSFQREKDSQNKGGNYRLIRGDDLDYQGSFSRGVQVGNRQSLLLNSNFNMQLAGTIGDDIHVLGAISDNTIPIQPDGNTRNLQEFDKIFMQVTKDQHTVLAGDYDLNRPTGYFINYYKKVSGIQYQYADSLSREWDIKARSGYAAARGKFARNTLKPQEGNQGPYQLSGNEGERFLVILAGTERVFWDGELLQRGADHDYAIDYNLGQIIFTYQRLVQSNARIIVEFEYIERDYGRSALTANVELSNKKGHFYLNAYQHTDSKSPSSENSLDSNALASLQSAGDQLSQAVISGSRPAREGELEDRILYILKDTQYTVANVTFDTSIFLYRQMPNESEALVVRFTQVEQGQGNYILSSSSANGRVYQWIAPHPESGIPQGNYRPEVRLDAPEQLRLISLGGEWQAGKNLRIKGEGIFSQKDQNRLSNLDDQDNEGFGGMIEMEYELPIAEEWYLRTLTRQELVQKRLEVVAPFRPAEFTRDWNTDLADQRDEWLQKYGLSIGKNSQNQLSWISSIYQREPEYQGVKHELMGGLTKNGWKLNTNSSTLIGKNLQEEFSFLRPRIDISKQFNNWADVTIGGYFFQEKNERKIDGQLIDQSFQFEEWSAFIQGPDKKSWKSQWRVRQRIDHRIEGNSFDRTSRGTDIISNFEYNASIPLTINIVGQWRKFEVFRPDLLESTDQNTLLIRLDEQALLFSRALELNNSYEISSGQEPLIEFVFEERRPGEGNYIYQDLNNDGVRQINEYISAPFVDTARYVRIQLLNTNFVTTRNLLFNQNIKIKPQYFWSDDAPLWSQKIEWSSVIKTNTKTTGESLFNPYEINFRDSLLMSSSAIINHQLYINKGSAKYDIQLGQRLLQTVQNQVAGREERKTNEWWFRSRTNLGKSSELIVRGAVTSQSNQSQFFEERRNDISGWTSSVEWNAVIRRKYRFTGSYGFSQKANEAEFGGEHVQQNELSLSFQFREAQEFNVRTGLVFHAVKYKDAGNEVNNFIMLEGLRDGSNFQWHIDFDKMLFRNIRLSLGYKGRKNGTGKTLHSGQANFTAQF